MELKKIVPGLLLGSLVALGGAELPGQVRRVVRQELNGRLILGGPGQATTGKFDDEAVANGASLKTDPELESILETADRIRQDGNYQVAAKLWQAVLQRSGDTLFSSDGVIYLSLVEEVEKILGGLPEEGLRVYRIVADANAKEVMAAASDRTDVAALNQVVRQYFLSSDGDEAAFALSQIYMDRYDFIGARRMLQKIVRLYPDPSVPMDQVHLRIALCESFLGENEAAQESLATSEQLASTESFDKRFQMVRDSIGNLSAVALQSQASGWTMPHGDIRRYGLMPSVPDSMMSSDLVAKWQYYFEPRDHYLNFTDAAGRTLVGGEMENNKAQGTANSLEVKSQRDWRSKEWRPAGHLVIQSNRLVYKSAADLLSWDLDEINESVAANDATVCKPGWRSLWQNSFRADGATLLLRGIRSNFSNYGRRRGINLNDDQPATDSEVQVFGDVIYQQMSLLDGVVYSIEGERFDGKNTNAEQNNRNAPWNATFRRTRENFITAYDAEGGKALWRLPRSELTTEKKQDDSWLTSGGFMSAPIKYGDVLIAPINQGGAISIYAFDPKKEGRTVWKAFLCDEPESSASVQSPINLSIDGSDLFVSCGVGVVFVLDPSTGMVRFARRYTRNGTVDRSFQRMWANPRTIFDGWEADIVLPYGRQMICFCSDSDVIYAYDRNSGDTIWYMDRETHYGLEVDYLLGIHNDVLYAAGRQTVIAVDLKSEGSLLWGGNNLFGEKVSLGRGMMTRDGVYIPVGNSIYHYALKSERFEPKLIARVNVDLGTDAPVGNLFSDGRRFWVHGGSRLYGLWVDDADDVSSAAPGRDKQTERTRRAEPGTDTGSG